MPDRFVPCLIYADAPAAMTFLRDAFGFEETMRCPMPDGRIGHAELRYQGSAVFLASAYEELGLFSPRQLPGLHCQVVCLVDDVDAHFARARAAGATIATEPEDQHGTRAYRAVDPEGHRWFFQRAR